jgi:hypothetical protein
MEEAKLSALKKAIKGGMDSGIGKNYDPKKHTGRII